MPKTQKTKKIVKKKSVRSVKKSSAKPKAKKVAAVKSVAISAPIKEEAVESQIREIKSSIENAQSTASRHELDKLIKAEALKDGVIFSDAGRMAVPVAERQSSEEQAAEQSPASYQDEYQEFEEHIYQGEEHVSPYRRFLLWSSVGVCASVICFGWFLTVAGSLGLKSADVEKMSDTELQQMADDMKQEFDNLKNAIRENTEKAEVEDNTIENLVEKIKNSTTSTQEVDGDERDIFNPPENAQENQ